MQAMHEQELEQVRNLSEGRLHDEVEQAKHDIVRALEEQIQVLRSHSFLCTVHSLRTELNFYFFCCFLAIACIVISLISGNSIL